MKSVIRSRISFSEWADDKRLDEIWPFGGKKGGEEDKSSVDTTLAKDALKQGVEGGQGVAKAVGGVAKLATGNFIGGGWDLVVGSINAFKGIKKCAKAASLLNQVNNYKQTLQQTLGKQGLPADKIISVLFEIDQSVSELFSPKLMDDTMASFVGALGKGDLKSQAFATHLAAAAANVYGKAQAFSAAAQQKIAELTQIPEQVQQQAVKVTAAVIAGKDAGNDEDVSTAQYDLRDGDRVTASSEGQRRGIPPGEEGTVAGVNDTEVYVLWDKHTKGYMYGAYRAYKYYSQRRDEVKPTGKNVGDAETYRKKQIDGPQEGDKAFTYYNGRTYSGTLDGSLHAIKISPDHRNAYYDNLRTVYVSNLAWDDKQHKWRGEADPD